MLGRLLGVGPDGGIGLALRLWRWALEMAPEGDFSGGIYDARALAAGVGWDPADAEELVAELVTVGLAKAIGTKVRVKGLDRYRKSFEENEVKRARWRRGNENRKDAAVNSAVTARLPLRETETETEKKETMSAKADVDPVERIFEKYQAAAQSPRSRLDAKRRRLIGARLEHFTEADLIRSLEGYAKSPHHHGENDRQTKYLTLELWFRDAGHVEAGMVMAAGPPLSAAPPTAIQTALTPYPESFL